MKTQTRGFPKGHICENLPWTVVRTLQDGRDLLVADCGHVRLRDEQSLCPHCGLPLAMSGRRSTENGST
jgi:predicted amidophosphoribosyltransferase